MKFFVTTFRYLTRDKIFSLINVLGLAIGLTAVLYISYYVSYQATYDNFHKNGENIYRFSMESYQNGVSDGESYELVPPIGPALKDNIPEVEEYTRLARVKSPLSYNNKTFQTDRIFFADTAFFKVFTYPLLKGDPSIALTVPYTVVLTEELAEKMFGTEDPIGKMILVDGQDYFTVTGVAKNPPQNTELRFNALFSFSTRYRMPGYYMGWNGGNQYYTYVLMNPATDIKNITESVNAILWEMLGAEHESFGWTMKCYLRPLQDLHLYYNYDSPYLRVILYVLLATTLLILVIAGINFVNLTTARSLKRIREAGVRKILGAKRSDLIRQFLGESLLVSVSAFILALLLFKLLEPVYTQLTDISIVFNTTTLLLIATVFVLSILIGIIGGSYPVIKLANIPLGDTARGGGEQKRGRQVVQSVLVIVQLFMSVVMIVLIGIVSNQLNYIRNKDIGINKDNILVFSLLSTDERKQAFVLKERLRNISGVKAVSLSSDVPVWGFTRNGYHIEGHDDVIMIYALDIDSDYFDVYGVQMKAGRNFSEDREADRSSYIINERMAALMGPGDKALEMYIERGGWHNVIGITKDFHFNSLYSNILPLIITNSPYRDQFNYLSVRYNTSNIQELIRNIENVWLEVNPNATIKYSFFDDAYESQYKIEQYVQTLFTYFAVVAIILAVLGMLSLMAYTTEQRKKEIGIRKVLGSSVLEIISLLLKKTGWQILIANLLAWPTTWWLAQIWLDNFAYRAPISPFIFIIASLISALIAFLAVGVQALRAATANPVDAIKTE
jgi:putative ABC transport system permease protein